MAANTIILKKYITYFLIMGVVKFRGVGTFEKNI
jgi:hypothetical protein